MEESINRSLTYREFINRENSIRHHSYDEEMLQYEYIKNGDRRAVEEAARIFGSEKTGHLSDDALRNIQYLFICSVTLVTRFAIEGGMDAEKGYNASDLYIQQVDGAKSVEEVRVIHREMISFFTESVIKAKREHIYSKQVIECMDYIYYHLHEGISVEVLAQKVGLNRSYLSTLFKKETGVSVSEYIMDKRMEAAENMLKYSDYVLADISEYLGFSSYSHFARNFRRYHGESPKEYRARSFRHIEMTGSRI